MSGCSVSLGDEGSSIKSQEHRTFTGAHFVRVENVSGPITITAAKGNSITVNATLSAGSQGAIDRTHVSFDRHGDSLDVATRYDRTGWFGDGRGASVAYQIAVPQKTDIDVENVSGSITIHGTAGDVRVSQVSGAVQATLGQINGSRNVNIKAVSGAITVAIARNSSATLNAQSISGGVHAFFPADEHKGMVGSSLRGRLGSGNGSIDLSTVSGAIDVNAQE